VFDLGGTPDDWEARLHLIRSLDRPGFQYLDYETPGAVVLLVEWLDS
jgi:hypothetical protein